MQLIQTVTVGSGGAANIEFTSIPATFEDILILLSLRAEGNTIGISPAINGSTANFSARHLEGTGSAASSYSAANIITYCVASSFTANTFSNASVYIPNYRSTTTAKSLSVDTVLENNATRAEQLMSAILWNQTAAINAIRFFTDNGSDIAEGSTATLYGITAGSSGGVVVS